ncbi:MAG: c-type cytochrome [Acidobacteria bacterium]|nr:c-type cytochrome [Acidobacteriota bacterium]
MKRWQKAVLFTVLALVVFLGAAITATIGWTPFFGPKARPLTDRRFEPSASRLARGEYIVRNVSMCLVCHSELDASIDGLPIKAGMAGAGRQWTPEGMPWLVAPNITPDRDTGAGKWTDDMIARAVREGIGHDGRALFPLMPYQNFRKMSDEDLASVVTYIRSLPAVRREHPKTAIPFPPGRLINAEPRPLDGIVQPPDLSTSVKRGEYLVTLASCGDCHTPMDDKGQYLPGMAFAGGNTLRYDPEREPKASANITPAPNGIPYYTEELFLEAIRTGRVRERKLTDVMPWGHYRNMSDEDLKGIFAYLKTLEPIDHRVDNTLPATRCPACGLEHGGGEGNKKR